MADGVRTVRRDHRFRLSVVMLGLVLALVCAAPLIVGVYAASLLRDAMLFSLLALALDYLWGKTGVLSFGHATFFGAGAYGAAIVSTRLGLDPVVGSWLGLIAGIAAAAAIALIVGYFLVFGGVRGSYFTIVTLALAVIAEHVIVGWSEVTGGDAGLLGIPPLYFPTTDGMAPLSAEALYWFVVAVVCVVTALLYRGCKGRYGSILRAIEDNELRARALGHNTSLHLLMVFVGSAAIAALGGALYASSVGFVAKDIVGLVLSTQVIIWVAIGGRGTLIGPILATIFILWLEQEVSSIDVRLWPLFMGGLFILTVFVFPDGILGKAEQLIAGARRHGAPRHAPRKGRHDG